MSFFGGGNMQARQQSINPQNIALAEQELEMVTDLFNRYKKIKNATSNRSKTKKKKKKKKKKIS
jgi:hypothetical protein